MIKAATRTGRAGLTTQVSATATTFGAAVLASLAVAVPASASTVLSYHGGRLTPEEIPALQPPSGPEAAITAREQECGAPAPVPAAPRPKVSAAGPSVSGAIATARRRKTITKAEAAQYRADYARAIRARSRLGRYRREEASQIAVLQGIAARGRLSGGRMAALFLQLRRNTQFWTGNPSFPPRTDIPSEPCTPRPPGTSSGAGSRIVFPGSKLVFQYYPGSGLQFQPLANFGMANGLVSQCRREPEKCDKPGLKQLLSELIAIRSSRGGFTTWEYWFYFGGGTPPWTSGLSQGTAIQALTRASEPSILNDKSYLKVARASLGAFQKAPPVGVRVRADGGSHYLIYSFDPGLRVLNGFLQAVTGLYDYARISGNKTARIIYKRGDRAARNELHRFDTGAWSLYSQGGAESSLGYHKLVTTFLGNLCKRLHGRYCVYRDRFRRYETSPPRLHYSGRRSARVHGALTISYSVDKVSCVTAEVTNAAGRRAYRARLKVARGAHAFTWAPRRRGAYKLTITALDPAKNKRVVTRTLRVR
jgi:hypothetical protein